MKKIGSSILGGAFVLSISAILVKIIGVLYKIPLSYILGDEGMGYFNTAYAVYGFFYVIASAGIPKAVTILVSESNSNGKREEAKIIYKRMLYIFALIGFILCTVFILFSSPISIWIGNSKSRSTMLAIAPSILFVSISGVARGYLNGYSKFGTIAISQLIEAISKLVGGLGFAIFGMRMSYSLPMISAITVLGITLGSFFSVFYLYIASFSLNRDKKTEQNIKLSVDEAVKKGFKIALPIMFSSALLSASNVMDLSMIMRGLKEFGISEASATALYGNYTTLAVPMLNLVVAVVSPISVALLPKLVGYGVRGDSNGFQNCISNGILLTSVLAFPAALIFFLYSFDILDILFDTVMSVGGASMLTILSASCVLLPILTTVNTALEAKGRVGKSLISLVLGVGAKLIFTYILIGKIGIYAAPIGTGVSYLISLLASISFLTTENVKISVNSILIPFLFSVFSFVPTYFILYYNGLPKSGIVGFIFTLILSAFIYLLLLSFVALIHKRNKKQMQSVQKSNTLVR